jgi:Flp pilus assembly protein TadB
LLVAGSVHTVKSAAIRPAVTATTGGTANVPVSIAEDGIATVLSILSIVIPILVGIILIILIALIIWWFWRRATRKHPANFQTK